MLHPFSVRPKGHRYQFQASKTGPRPPREDRVESDVMVTPLARGLAVLAAFSSKRDWLGNKEIALEAGIPGPTVSRLLHSLVELGYVHYDAGRRKYRLAAPALTLGYAAVAEGEIQVAARTDMQKFADATDSYFMLGTRDRLDVVVIDTRVGRDAKLAIDMSPGTRLSLAGSVAGAALLSALPELERCYLEGVLAHKGGAEWPSQRRRMAEKISQIRDTGFATSLGEWVPEISSVSVPLCLPEHPPWVLSCIGLTTQLTKPRVEREIGPRLVAMAQSLRERLLAD